MLNRIYAAAGAVLLGLYGLFSFMGWEIGNPPRHVVSAQDRQTRGWLHTSAHTWHSGYRGGK